MRACRLLAAAAALLAGCKQPTPAPAPPAADAARTGAADDHSMHGASPHHRFEHAEDWVARFDDPARDAWQRPADVIALLALTPGMTVADVGAGTGYFMRSLSVAVGEHGHVLALDVEPDMVRYMKERAAREQLANVEPRKVEGGDPGLADASVDRVLVVDTWHHLEDRPAYVRKLAAALEPGGFVMVVDFTMETRMGPPPAMRLTPEQVGDELAAGGLVPAIVEEPLPEQYVVIGRKPE